MLEQIQTPSEDRRKVQVMVDAGLLAFGLAALTDGIALGGGTAPIAVGAATALAGLASLAWLRVRPAAKPARA